VQNPTLDRRGYWEQMIQREGSKVQKRQVQQAMKTCWVAKRRRMNLSVFKLPNPTHGALTTQHRIRSRLRTVGCSKRA
jgi:hypothetical protein